MPDALKRSLALFLVFAFAFLSVYLFRAWQGGHPIFGLGGEPPKNQFTSENATLASEPPLTEEEVPGLARQNAEMTKLVERVTPSVVSIDIDVIKTKLFRYPGTNRIQKGYERVPSLGSGVIVSEEGHIVTNHHVIEGYERIRVTLHDGRSLPATLISSDEILDIAVLRLKSEGETFAALKFADSDLVKVGQLAIAIGNPFGLGESVTVGHISARDRSYSDKDRDLFQTDAAINPGNSGGPLLNHLGEIIGINASIYSKNSKRPGFQGIGFSIPANDVKRSFNIICEKGRPVYGYLGLGGLTAMDGYLKSAFPYSGEGVLVMDVVPDSPADLAGIKPNDIITSFNNEGVTTPQEFLTRLQRSIVGSECTLSVQRGDQVKNFTAIVGEVDPFGTPFSDETSKLRLASDNAIKQEVGLNVENLPLALQARNVQGVIISEVRPNSLADKYGLRRKDIIRGVNGIQVRNRGDFFFRLVASAAVQKTSLRIRRGHQETNILLPQIPHAD